MSRTSAGTRSFQQWSSKRDVIGVLSHVLLAHDLFRKPVSSPDQVRARLFRDYAQTDPVDSLSTTFRVVNFIATRLDEAFVHRMRRRHVHPCGAIAASVPRVAQPVMRRSTISATRYIPMPITLVTSSPAKASGTSKRDEATSIRLPIPLLEATVSATIDPTNATVIATFSEAKKYGIERG